MLEVPPSVQGALAGARPDLVVRARRVGRRSSLLLMGALGSGVGLFLLILLVAVLSGTGTVTEGGVEVPATGSRMVIPALLLLAFMGIAAFVFGRSFQVLLAPGPWYAVTPEGFVVMEEGCAPRMHPWSDFVAARRDGRDVVLSARMEAKVLPRGPKRNGPLFGPDEIVLVEPEDPDRVLAALEARIPKPPPLMHQGFRPGA